MPDDREMAVGDYFGRQSLAILVGIITLFHSAGVLISLAVQGRIFLLDSEPQPGSGKSLPHAPDQRGGFRPGPRAPTNLQLIGRDPGE